ncbi:hypothetical protein IG631_17179 [Alternaria alternata]|nr:hypothetical protein IG631_17179 [Alternaria alternata]
MSGVVQQLLARPLSYSTFACHGPKSPSCTDQLLARGRRKPRTLTLRLYQREATTPSPRKAIVNITSYAQTLKKQQINVRGAGKESGTEVISYAITDGAENAQFILRAVVYT